MGKRTQEKNSHTILQTFVKSLEVINSHCEDLDLIDVIIDGEYKTLNKDDLHGDKRTPKYNADLTFFS